MRLPKLLIVLIGVAAAGPALAEPPDDQAVAQSVVILRGSSAPPTPWYTPPPAPREVEVREVVYYVPAYYLALPSHRFARRHQPIAVTARRK
jgi:hypothetical protein